MSKEFFKVKKGINLDPISSSSVSSPEVGDIIVDSSDNNKLKRYDGVTASWKDVGSGVGGINYISTNSDFEGGTTGYAEYKDAPAESPVDGIGGTALYTSISTTTSALRGTESGLISKTANNAQGEGVSYDFTIDSADQAQVLRISFDYNTEASTTNYADGDIRLYVYDVTNSRLIEVIDRDLYASSFGKFVGTFQTSPDSTSYRLIFHIASTNALAYTVTVDNVIVGPQTIVKGAIVTEWEAFTPALNSTTNITPTGYWRRVGSDAEFSIRLDFTGAGASASLTMSLPNGLSIDTSKITTITDQVTKFNSTGNFLDASAASTANNFDISAFGLTTATGFRFVVNTTDDWKQFNPASVPVATAAGDVLTLNLKVPILGWSSNVVLSEDAGNREIVVDARTNSGGTITTGNPIQFSTTFTDTSASWNGTEFTAPETGYYDVSGVIYASEITSAQLALRIDGLQNLIISEKVGDGSGERREFAVNAVLLMKGQVLTITSSINLTLIVSTVSHYIKIAKRSSPQTIAASEVVAMRATSNSGQTIEPGIEPVVFEDVLFDTHNAYDNSTGTYTVPQSGYYSISARVMFGTSSAWAAGDTYYLQINGYQRAYSEIFTTVSQSSYFAPPTISDTIYFTKGQTISLSVGNDSTTNKALFGNAIYNTLSIVKVG